MTAISHLLSFVDSAQAFFCSWHPLSPPATPSARFDDVCLLQKGAETSGRPSGPYLIGSDSLTVIIAEPSQDERGRRATLDNFL